MLETISFRTTENFKYKFKLLHNRKKMINNLIFEGEQKEILFVQDEKTSIFKKIIEHLCIPEKKYGILYIPKKINTSKIIEFFKEHKPKLVISIGKIGFSVFNPLKKMKDYVGKLIEFDNEYGIFIYCPLYNPNRYKHIKMSNEYKQLDNLKKYIMRYYKYGLITDDRR